MMQTRPVFRLFVPYLLKSLNSWNQDFDFDVIAPNLSTLLRNYSMAATNNSSSIYTAYYNSVNHQTLPIAYYRQQLHLNEIHDNIICADPVYLEVGMTDVVLTDKITDLSDLEAKELLDTFNKHFEQDGLTFIYGSNRHWYVLLEKAEFVNSYDINSVFQQNIVEKLAHSQDRNWKVIQNEVQMLLHSSEVNKHREIAGLKPVNSLWFWGSGIPVEPRFNAGKVISREDVSSKVIGQLFARTEKCEWEKLPQNGLRLLDNSNDTADKIVILDQLFMPALENNLDEFQAQLTLIDELYIHPLLDAWKLNNIDIVIDCCDGQVITPRKVPVWKFWIKPQDLRKVSR